MKPADAPSVGAWLALAESDLRIARLVLPLTPPEHHAVCFHAQQAGEKALKALLEAGNQPIPRTHDLALLTALLQLQGFASAEIAVHAAMLSDYGVTPRYPMPTGSATYEEARDAVASAEAVVAWVLGQFRAELW